MPYPPKTKENAYALWCAGKTYEQVAKALNIKRVVTVCNWAKKAGPDDLTWAERRKKTEGLAQEIAVNITANDIAARLVEHDRAAKHLRAAALAALDDQLRRTTTKNGKKITIPPDHTALANIGRAFKTAVYLERQALGLPTDTSKTLLGTDGKPLQLSYGTDGDPRLKDVSDEDLQAIIDLARTQAVQTVRTP